MWRAARTMSNVTMHAWQFMWPEAIVHHVAMRNEGISLLTLHALLTADDKTTSHGKDSAMIRAIASLEKGVLLQFPELHIG